MNPEVTLVLGCFGLGLNFSLGIWLLMDNPLRKLEEKVALRRSGSRQRPGVKPSSAIVDGGYFSQFNDVVREFENSWKDVEEPSLESYLNRPGSPKSLSLLALLVEADLRNRFLRGQRPSVSEYLVRYPRLARSTDRVVNLVSEEYRLLERRGERPDRIKFIENYPRYSDLLVWRLENNLENRQDSMHPAGASD